MDIETILTRYKELSVLLVVFGVSITDDASLTCPPDMVLVGNSFCMDKYEAPNQKGGQPLVMFSFVESEAWCESRGKRLCYVDEWEVACQGSSKNKWSYGSEHQKGVCNDGKTWRQYAPKKLRKWDRSASDVDISSFYEQTTRMDRISLASSDHVRNLYQADPSGSNKHCVSDGVYDLLGNVEEWTRRRHPKVNFSGVLKGRFWAEPRHCIQRVSNHGDLFRFYETGFRCCKSID